MCKNIFNIKMYCIKSEIKKSRSLHYIIIIIITFMFISYKIQSKHLEYIFYHVF